MEVDEEWASGSQEDGDYGIRGSVKVNATSYDNVARDGHEINDTSFLDRSGNRQASCGIACVGVRCLCCLQARNDLARPSPIHIHRPSVNIMHFGPFRFTTLFLSQTGGGDVPCLQNLQFNLNGRLVGLDDFTEEHSHRLERERVIWQGLVFIKTDDGGPPLTLSERGLGLFQRQAFRSNCPLDWKNGLSVIIEGDYVAHNIKCKSGVFLTI